MRVGTRLVVAFLLLAGLTVLAPSGTAGAAPPGQTEVQGTIRALIFGNPVPGAIVMVLSPTTGFVVGSDVTDGSGNYSLLAPSGSGNLFVVDPAGGHIALYEPTATTLPDTGTVTANRFITRALGGIEGRITDQGSGLGLTRGLAVAIDHATGYPRGAEPTDGLGFFVIRNLRSVGYKVELLDLDGAHQREFYSDAATPATANPVNVVGGALVVIGTQAVAAQTAPGGTATVQGTVTNTAPVPVGLPFVAVLVYDATTGAFEAGGITDGSGNYSVPVDPGSYKVAFVDTDELYQAEWNADTPYPDVASAPPVSAPSGGSVTVNAQLGLARGSLAGQITEEGTGTPLSGVLVLAVDASGVAGQALTDGSGNYTMTNVPVGEVDIWVTGFGGTHYPEYHDGQVGDGYGHDTTATSVAVVGGATTTIDADLTPVESISPTIVITTPGIGALYEAGSVVNADYSCSDTGSGVRSCVGAVPDGSPIDTSTLGPHPFEVTAIDRGYNSATLTQIYDVQDTVAPSVSVTTPADGATFAVGAIVNADYACADLFLVSCAGPVPDGSPIDTAILGPHSFTVTATDTSGNPRVVTHDYTVVSPNVPVGDRTAPTVRIITPPAGATYFRTQVVPADYGCADEVGGSGLASCVGDVAYGDPIDTSTPGEHTFSVTATDAAGNRVTVTRTYTVVEAECFGRTVTVYLGLGDTPTGRADVVFGTPGADTLVGLGGVDRVCGRGGADTIRGGPGPDVLRGGPGDDTLVGGPGNDTAWGGPGTDSCLLAPGHDIAHACEP